MTLVVLFTQYETDAVPPHRREPHQPRRFPRPLDQHPLSDGLPRKRAHDSQSAVADQVRDVQATHRCQGRLDKALSNLIETFWYGDRGLFRLAVTFRMWARAQLDYQVAPVSASVTQVMASRHALLTLGRIDGTPPSCPGRRIWIWHTHHTGAVLERLE